MVVTRPSVRSTGLPSIAHAPSSANSRLCPAVRAPGNDATARVSRAAALRLAYGGPRQFSVSRVHGGAAGPGSPTSRGGHGSRVDIPPVRVPGREHGRLVTNGLVAALIVLGIVVAVMQLESHTL